MNASFIDKIELNAVGENFPQNQKIKVRNRKR
jgi:hypothetical protein